MKVTLFFILVIAVFVSSCSKSSESIEDPLKSISLTVTSDDSQGLAASNSVDNLYKAGDTVNLKASPKSGYVFSYWKLPNGLTNENNPFSFVINENTSVVAVFETKTAIGYSLNVDYNSLEGMVTVNPYKKTYDKGDVVELSANPASGYEFKGWSNSSSEKSKITITISQDTNIIALFKRKESNDGSKPYFRFTGERIKKDGVFFWIFNTTFTAIKNTDEEAVINLNSTKVKLKDGYCSFSINDKDMVPGKLIAFELHHSSLIKTLNATLIVPENFTGIDDWSTISDQGTLNFQWPTVKCDGYVVNRKLGNSSGVITLDFGTNVISDNKLSMTQEKILDSSPVETSSPMNRYAISISPVFILNDLTGFSTGSFIMLKGSSTRWITNYNNRTYWGL